MRQDLIAHEWIARPTSAASDWPASELDGHRLPVPVSLRVVKGENVIGILTRVTTYGLEIDHGTARVPFGVIRAYAMLHEQRDDWGEPRE